MTGNEEEEKMKKLVNFRSQLEKRIAETKRELENLQNLMETLDTILLEKGFKRLEPSKIEVSTVKSAEEAKPQALAEYKVEIPMKTVTGEKLATMYVGEDFIRIIMESDKRFRDDIPPFRQFLIERVFMKMQEKDREAARQGVITPDKIFSYSIVKEDDVIREIIIRNVNEERIRDLKSSIRWTLEKMFEKLKTE